MSWRRKQKERTKKWKSHEVFDRRGSPVLRRLANDGFVSINDERFCNKNSFVSETESSAERSRAGGPRAQFGVFARQRVSRDLN